RMLTDHAVFRDGTRMHEPVAAHSHAGAGRAGIDAVSDVYGAKVAEPAVRTDVDGLAVRAQGDKVAQTRACRDPGPAHHPSPALGAHRRVNVRHVMEIGDDDHDVLPEASLLRVRTKPN